MCKQMLSWFAFRKCNREEAYEQWPVLNRLFFKWHGTETSEGLEETADRNIWIWWAWSIWQKWSWMNHQRGRNRRQSTKHLDLTQTGKKDFPDCSKLSMKRLPFRFKNPVKDIEDNYYQIENPDGNVQMYTACKMAVPSPWLQLRHKRKKSTAMCTFSLHTNISRARLAETCTVLFPSQGAVLTMPGIWSPV